MLAMLTKEQKFSSTGTKIKIKPPKERKKYFRAKKYKKKIVALVIAQYILSASFSVHCPMFFFYDVKSKEAELYVW
jgi:hypothetical protein